MLFKGKIYKCDNFIKPTIERKYETLERVCFIAWFEVFYINLLLTDKYEPLNIQTKICYKLQFSRIIRLYFQQYDA